MKTSAITKSNKMIGWLVRGLGFSAQMALVSMVITICYDVAMRYIFARPTLWCLEVNTFLIVFLAVIPASDVERADKHLKISFLPDRLGVVGLKVQRTLCSLLGIFFCLVMVFKGFGMAQMAFQYGERMSTALGTPLFIPYLLIPIGFSVLILQFIVSIIGDLTNTSQRETT
ncbi:MAG: TRAP transporter small permease [Desulforhopalus sp.]